MPRPLFEIWEAEKPGWITHPWCAQLVNYVGSFPSKIHAELFIEATKKSRAQEEKAGVKIAPTKKSR
jgi:hypothetical protein